MLQSHIWKSCDFWTMVSNFCETYTIRKVVSRSEATYVAKQ